MKAVRSVRNERGIVSIFVMVLTTLFLGIGIAGLDIQNAALRDTYGVSGGGQAKFLAESALQEAQYLVTHLNSSYTGTTNEQTVYDADGLAIGTYTYTVTRNGNTFSVQANGYVPNRSARKKSTETLTSTFTYTSVPVTPTSPGVILLNLSAAGQLTQIGASWLVANAGGKVWMSSNSDESLILHGATELIATEFDLVGNYRVTNGAKLTGPVKKVYTPFTDPFTYVQVPDPATMTVQSASTKSITGAAVLNPGVYVGGIKITGSASVTMNPGVYYIKGGGSNIGLQVSGSASLTAQRVFVYNEGSNSTQTLNVTTSGNVSWTPPTSGTYNGFTYFQARNSNARGVVVGAGKTNIGGTVYMPYAELDLGGTCNVGSLIVADTMAISNNGNISTNNYASFVH